jgi:hypothetical protein
LIAVFFFLFIVVFFDRWYLQDCSVTLWVVYLFVFNAEKGPLGSTIALRQALDQRNQLFFHWV